MNDEEFNERVTRWRERFDGSSIYGGTMSYWIEDAPSHTHCSDGSWAVSQRSPALAAAYEMALPADHKRLYGLWRDRYVRAITQEDADADLAAMLRNVTLEGELPGWGVPNAIVILPRRRIHPDVRYALKVAGIALIVFLGLFAFLAIALGGGS